MENTWLSYKQLLAFDQQSRKAGIRTNNITTKLGVYGLFKDDCPSWSEFQDLFKVWKQWGVSVEQGEEWLDTLKKAYLEPPKTPPVFDISDYMKCRRSLVSIGPEYIGCSTEEWLERTRAYYEPMLRTLIDE